MSVAVSVILPVYNRSSTLARACQSVLTQSFLDLELIIVDDASTEDVKAIIDTLDDPRIVYIRHETNAGAAAARNTGLSVAKGRLIAFQDSDDMWLPGKLKRQVALLDDFPAEIGVVTAGKILYGSDGSGNYGHRLVSYSPPPWRPPMTPEEDQIRRSLLENRLSLQNALFRRDVYPGAEWFDPLAHANNDWEFTIRLVKHTRIFEDSEPVVLAFTSADSISTNRRRKLTGHLLILKKHRHLAARYSESYGLSLYVFGRGLWKIGHRRFGRRFMLKGLRSAPVEVARSLLQTLYRKARDQLRSALHR